MGGKFDDRLHVQLSDTNTLFSAMLRAKAALLKIIIFSEYTILRVIAHKLLKMLSLGI